MHLILIGIPNDTKMYLVKTLYLHIQTDFKGQVTTSLNLLSLLEAALLAVTHGRGKFALYEKPDPSTPHPALGDGDVIVDLTYGSASRTQGWWCTGGEELVELADDYLFEELGDVQEKVMNGNRRPLTSGAVMFRDYRGIMALLSKREPWLWQLRSSQGFIVFVVSLSMLTDMFMYGMIVPIMPTAIVTRAGIPVEDRVFWTSILLICESGTAFITSPLFGYFVDVSRTRQLPFLVGLFLLTLSMTFLTVARSMTGFVIGRLLQGSAAAMVNVAGLALAVDAVDKEHLGEILGYLGTASMIGIISGPPLGGLAYHAGGYYAVCGLAFAMIAVDLVLRVVVIEKRRAGELSKPVDDNTTTEGLRNGYSSFPRDQIEDVPQSEGKGVFAILTLLKQPRMLITLWAFVAEGIVTASFDATLVSFVEKTFGWGPFQGGLVFLLLAIPALFEPLFGNLTDCYGVRIMAITSFLAATPILLSLQFITTNTLPHKILLPTLVTLAGLATDLAQPALYLETQLVVDTMEARNPGVFGEKGAVAQAFSLQVMASFAGLMLGPMVGGFLSDQYGWAAMAWSLGLLTAVTAGPMMFLSSTGSTTTIGSDEEEQEAAEEQRQRSWQGRNPEREPLLAGTR